MPTLTYDKKDLLKLIGKKLSDKQLVETINLMKPSVEKITEDEITLELTPDRPDLFGVEGLARAIRAYLEAEGLTKYSLEEAKFEVKADPVPIRPYIACAIVKGVKLTDELIKSLMNIQEILHETIGRKRKKVAIGVHDLNKIEPPITYTKVSPDERFVPLEGTEELSLKEIVEKNERGRAYGYIISSSAEWPVYKDSKGIFSFPPVINSDRTKVTERTSSLFIELTGIDKQALLQTLNILVTNLAERKCKIEAVRIKYEDKEEITPILEESVIEIEQDFVNRWIGLKLKGKEIIKLLQRMGFDALKTKGEKLEVFVPCYRTDILHAVDITEDIAIAYGYNNLIPELPNVATIGKADELEKFCNRIRSLLVGYGFIEVLRPTLSNPLNQYEKMNLEKGKAIEIENPVSEEYTCLRTWLLPSLMKVLAANRHVEYPQNIFEIGDVVLSDEKEEGCSKTIRKVCALLCHSKASFSEIKSIVESLLKNLGIEYELKEVEHKSFIEGRVAEIFSNSKKIGIFGEIAPEVLESWELEMPVAAFELNLEVLFR